jgi:hypothetical protein
MMRLLRALVILIAFSSPIGAHSSPSGYIEADRAFAQLTNSDRLTFKMLMTSAGYWPETASGGFSRKLFDAVKQYQADNGLTATGVIGGDLLQRLHQNGEPLLRMWGFRQIAHPTRGRPIWIPMGLGLVAERDLNGLTWRDPLKHVWLTYDFLRNVKLAAAYDSVVSKVVADGGEISYKSLQSDFFVVSSSTNGVDSLIRCQSDDPGVLWLSVFWVHSQTDLHIERAATLISGSFSSAMTGAPFAELP